MVSPSIWMTIIGGKNFQEYYDMLKDVLQQLREAGLTLSQARSHYAATNSVSWAIRSQRKESSLIQPN